jgi:dCMP deaminase
MIIGVSGKNASGKGEIARYLCEKGFEFHSLSDVIRKDLSRTGDDVSRTNLITRGIELRTRFGPSILADRIIVRLKSDQNIIVDSIRHSAEVEAFRKINGFTMVWVEAGDDIRFKRIRARKREGDPRTLDEFREIEEREISGESEFHQQLQECRELADRIIENNGTIEEINEKVDRLIIELNRDYRRPSWDEYFMEIARVVALRSNCLKRKVAAVIVKDKRIISTGYNGTPRGTKNCNEGGCPRCAKLTKSGTDLSECYCSHGEENAITQAAYHGVSLKGAIIYSTLSPCLICTKMIINTGITEVIYNEEYPLSKSSVNLLKEAGVKARKLKLQGDHFI